MSGYMFRGGALMPVSMAEQYDSDAATAKAAIQKLLPDAHVWTEDSSVMAELNIDGERWVLQAVAPDARRWGYQA